MLKLFFYLFFASLFCFSSLSLAHDTDHVRYPVSADPKDTRFTYPSTLLSLILSKTSHPFKIKPIPITADPNRLLILLEQKKLDIYWAGVGRKAPSETTQIIKLPLFKGLLGYRLIMLHKDNKDILRDVKNVDDLRQFSIGQGLGWSEVEMYQEAGFDVHISSYYSSLFDMLKHKRFDLFPRSVTEVWEEYEAYGKPDLVIGEHVLLRYPQALFFVLRREDAMLADSLEKGFKQIIASGEFDDLFNSYFKNEVYRIHNSQRTIIDIPHPLYGAIPDKEKHLYIQP